jgi:hypothetical protein
LDLRCQRDAASGPLLETAAFAEETIADGRSSMGGETIGAFARSSPGKGDHSLIHGFWSAAG